MHLHRTGIDVLRRLRGQEQCCERCSRLQRLWIEGRWGSTRRRQVPAELEEVQKATEGYELSPLEANPIYHMLDQDPVSCRK